MTGLRIGAQRDYSARGVQLYIWERTLGGEAVAQRITFAEQPEGKVLEPCIKLPFEAAQQLIDDLWNAGFRPANAKATDETTAAQRSHIEDLRSVTTRLLDVMTKAALNA